MKNIDFLKTIIDRLIELSHDETYVNNMSKDDLISAIEAITDISEGNPTYDLTQENERS
jgi:hypothetical protein